MPVMGDPAAIYFRTAGTGWIWQLPLRGRVLTSKDGGRTWIEAGVPDRNQSSPIVSMWSTQDGHVFALRSSQDMRHPNLSELLTLDPAGHWVVVYTWGA